MDKDLLEYKKYIENEISKIERQLSETKNQHTKELILEKLDKLSSYHNSTIRNFQHERFVHLFVTLFFAGLLLLSLGVSLSFVILPISYDIQKLLNLSLLVSLILLVVEIFYIRHYYRLENNTQILYKSSIKLFELTRNQSDIDTKAQAS